MLILLRSLFRMVDNSNFVLRWVIDDATAAFARKKAESEEFNEEGFKWIVALDDRLPSNDDVVLSLRCDSDHNGPWKCEVELDMYLLYSDGLNEHVYEKKRIYFNEVSCRWLQPNFSDWSWMNDKCKINDKTTLEFRINIISSQGNQSIVESFLYDAPNRMSNVVLKIGDKKLHVSKEMLAVHSPVFETLFFGNFIENGKEEVEIKDVVFEEFLDLLHLIYTRSMEITDRTVAHILKIADQYQMEIILEQAKKYLTQSKGINVMKKLLLADKYRLDSLRDQCLRSFTEGSQVLAKLKSSPEYAEFSAEMKVAICDQMVQLS